MGVKPVCINSKWSIRVHYKRMRACVQVQPNTEAAAIEAAQKLSDMLKIYGKDALNAVRRRKVEVPRAIPTLKEYALQWAVQLEIEPIKRSTRESYAYLMHVHVVPEFGARRLDKISYSDLKAWVQRKLKERSKNTVRLMVGALRSLMTEAVKDGHVARNPVEGLGRFFREAKQVKEKIDPFTLEELHAIEAKCQERFPEYYGFLLLMSRTGMRIGEATGIQWRDIDEKTAQILVRRNIPHHREVDTPKTDASERRVDMSLELAGELYRLRVARKAELLKAARKWDTTEYMFRTQTGTPIHYNNFVNRVWNRCQELARVRIRSPHNLRHTWASQMLHAGADPAYVAAQLGHSSPAITLRIYAHWIPGSKRVGAEVLDRNANRTQTNELADKGEMV